MAHRFAGAASGVPSAAPASPAMNSRRRNALSPAFGFTRPYCDLGCKETASHVGSGRKSLPGSRVKSLVLNAISKLGGPWKAGRES
jgi:hypothetical protein